MSMQFTYLMPLFCASGLFDSFDSVLITCKKKRSLVSRDRRVNKKHSLVSLDRRVNKKYSLVSLDRRANKKHSLVSWDRRVNKKFSLVSLDKRVNKKRSLVSQDRRVNKRVKTTFKGIRTCIQKYIYSETNYRVVLIPVYKHILTCTYTDSHMHTHHIS